MRQWRLIYDEALPGARNMAVDEAILGAVSAGEAAPTLRLYAWQPFCLSLGYGQRMSDVDIQRLHAHSWEVVRRPTGGKAILHGDELTYSVSLPIDHPLAQGDVVSSYRRISEALMAALQKLGLQPQSEAQAKGNQGLGAVCFEVPSHYEITTGGRKLIGSAQVRRKLGVLQHGTLPLWGDIGRICDALYYPSDADRAAARHLVRQRATTLEAALGRSPAYAEVAQAFVAAFEETFGISLLPGALTPQESELAQALQTATYSTDAWTQKR